MARSKKVSKKGSTAMARSKKVSKKGSTAMARSKKVSKKGSTAMAVVDFEQEAGQGFENADQDAYALPFLKVLQKLSPQCDDDTDDYIEGAKPGMLFNTVTNEFVDSVMVVPVYYARRFVEWIIREEGGGYVAEYAPEDAPKPITRDDKGRDILENGHQITDNRMHYCLVIKEDGSFEPVVIAMSSTQIKKSRKWMSRMNGIKLTNKNKELYTPASYSHVYQLSTIGEENASGSWKGWSIELVGPVEDGNLYNTAKELHNSIEAGAVKAAPIATQEEEAEENY